MPNLKNLSSWQLIKNINTPFYSAKVYGCENILIYIRIHTSLKNSNWAKIKSPLFPKGTLFYFDKRLNPRDYLKCLIKAQFNHEVEVASDPKNSSMVL